MEDEARRRSASYDGLTMKMVGRASGRMDEPFDALRLLRVLALLEDTKKAALLSGLWRLKFFLLGLVLSDEL